MKFITRSVKLWKAVLFGVVIYAFSSLNTNIDEVSEVRRDAPKGRSLQLNIDGSSELPSESLSPTNSIEGKMFREFPGCDTQPRRSLASQRGDYWVLENYILATKSFKCDESITLTTQGDYNFLDNLITLAKRWKGPISMAMYAPGTDFKVTLKEIYYLRECVSPLVKELVTFHLIYHQDHVPDYIPSQQNMAGMIPDCKFPKQSLPDKSYRNLNNLHYHINMARNVARRASTTYFVFPSDIELYPSINFIPEFFKMIKRPDIDKSTKPRVYVFYAFEVESDIEAPETKEQLIPLLKSGKAIYFHMRVCPKCHNIPYSEEWKDLPISSNVSVAYSVKREGNQKSWEPFFLCTNDEPFFDERITWEAKNDKRIQGYVLCVRDYEFHVMDNAFIVHRPGIKVYEYDAPREKLFLAQRRLIIDRILPEYKKIFGSKLNCEL